MTERQIARAAFLTLCVALVTACNNPPSDTHPRTPGAAPITGNRQPDFGGSRAPNPDPSPRRPRRARPSTDNQPGDFDFYLLTLSWSPEFCATHAGSPECSAHPGFVVHGLWPQNNDGTYPERCSSAPGPSNPGQYTNLLPTASLVEHEWSTHGTCSGLSPDAYFTEIATAFHRLHIPAQFTGAQQPPTLTPRAIIDSFAAANPGLAQQSLALSCGRNYLTAVELCLSKSLQPQACPNVHTCGATSVKITPR